MASLDPKLKYQGKHESAKISLRSNVADVMRNIREKLNGVEGRGRQRREQLIRESCFGSLIFNLPSPIQISSQVIHHLLLRQVEATHEGTSFMRFLVGGKLLDFGLEDFHQITGLNIGEVKFPKEVFTGSSTISKRHFNNAKKISIHELECAYLDLETEDDEEFVRMSILYFVECGLIGKNKKTLIDHRHLMLADRLDFFNQFSWGRVIFEFTIQSLKNGLVKWRSHGQPVGRRTYSLYGFPYVLQVWVYERIPLAGKKYGSLVDEYVEHSPLLLKWKSASTPRSEEVSSFFNQLKLAVEVEKQKNELQSSIDKQKYKDEHVDDNHEINVPVASMTRATLSPPLKRIKRAKFAPKPLRHHLHDDLSLQLDGVLDEVRALRVDVRAVKVEVSEMHGELSKIQHAMDEVLSCLHKASGPLPKSQDGDDLFALQSCDLFTMKREMPWGDNVAVISSDDSSSSDADVEVDDKYAGKRLADQPANKMTFEDALVKRAEMYQEYMKQIPIPTHRGSVIPFSSWIGLGKSIKQLYGQPLHCLTNILLKEWDELRFHNEDTEQPLDTIIHPCKAEASVWLIEEVHRKTTSYHHLSKLWRSDPMYHAFIDSIFPKLRGGS